MNLVVASLAMAMALVASAASANDLSIDLQPARGNPASPQMGDNLSFHTIIRNDGSAPVDGMIAWINLLQIDSSNEQPVDLEDWSAHKAITAASLPPSQMIESDWPIRLIQAGDYRVFVSVVSREGQTLTVSPFADFSVRRKAVVESARILPVALGLPALIALAMIWRYRRSRRRAELTDL